MKTNAIVNVMNNAVNKVNFKVRKHSPEILLVTGIVGVIGSAVMACKATTKAGEIIEETKGQLDDIHACASNETFVSSGKYTAEDARKDTAIVYVQTAVKFAKLYGPSVCVGALSIVSILASNNILRKRNVALAAAYATVDSAFKDYRKRVVERFGEVVDKELRYNLKAEKVTEKIKNPETGEEEKVKKTKFVVNPSDVSGYARFFDKYTVDENGNTITNPCWQSNNEYNLMYIKAQERYANDLLVTRGRLFLNEVYRMLGLPETKAGQVVGWVYDPDNKLGRDEESFNNYVSFGLYNDNLSYSDYVNGFDPAILLDFNVDGNIWELMH